VSFTGEWFMRVTRVVIYPFDTSSLGGQVKAMADVELDGELLIKGFKVVASKRGGVFISYPSKRVYGGRYYDVVLPLSKELKEHIREEILKAYRDKVEEKPCPD